MNDVKNVVDAFKERMAVIYAEWRTEGRKYQGRCDTYFFIAVLFFGVGFWAKTVGIINAIHLAEGGEIASIVLFLFNMNKARHFRGKMEAMTDALVVLADVTHTEYESTIS